MLLRKIVLLFIVSALCVGCGPKIQKPASKAFSTVSGEAVSPNTALVFPDDHGIHQRQGIEWWYLTSNLQTESGESFGVQWTLFRTLMPGGVSSSWWDNNLYFAHFAMQHKQQHVAFERFGRKGQASVTSRPFSAAIDNWVLASVGTEFLPLNLTAEQSGYSVNLQLSNSPRVLHGDQGFSQKTQTGHASYYFSYPFLEVTGTLTFQGREYQVSGNAWYDREWSASLLDKDKLGWDWFSIIDESGDEKKGLMLFCIRNEEQGYDYCSGTKIDGSGNTQIYQSDQITLSVIESVRLDGRAYPSQWQVSLPDYPPIEIKTVTKDSRNHLSVPYWEGRITASGGLNAKGYAELTGY